ncbi:MAG: YwiC-like family protein [Acidimicrobiales bacterium]|nr:YwiC-like family protein [Acidimicrobiales bacterium]
MVRSVAVPTEHGGWGLTLEPAVLGLLVAPSGAGWCLAAAALVAFVARTPLKVVLVDRWRRRRLDRTVVAARVAAVEVAGLVALVTIAALLATDPFWWPALVAAPLVVVELWFDMRSRSRRLIPELAGAVGVCAVSAMIVLADGADSRLAIGLWLILAARVVTSVPFVRAQIDRLHHRPGSAHRLLATDLAALGVAAAAVWIEPSVLAGAIAVGAVVVFQRVTARGPVPRAGVIGSRQMAIGFGVAVVTALGVLAP